MTAITAELVPERDVTYGRSAVSHFVTDVWVLTKRSIARIRREPETLADVTFMPVSFSSRLPSRFCVEETPSCA